MAMTWLGGCGHEARGVRRLVMMARRRTPGGRVRLGHGKKAQLVGGLTCRQESAPDLAVSHRVGARLGRSRAGHEDREKGKERARAWASAALGRHGNWAMRGMEGVGLRKGWSGAGPARLRWLGHQAKNRERERFFLFFISKPFSNSHFQKHFNKF